MAIRLQLAHKKTKVYENRENLEKAINKLNLPNEIAYLECWTESGKITAVFINTQKYGYTGFLAQKGFKVVG